MVICLGIEGTAHTLGIGIIQDEKILVNISKQYIPEKGGIHPREAVEHHTINFKNILVEALEKSKLNLKDIDLIAFSQGPGLGPCLRTVAIAARTLSQLISVELVGVNHCLGHVEIGKKETGALDPIVLYVSGGNTMVIGYEAGKYRIFGETLDIPIGNLLDTFARHVGLQHPGGPKIEKLAKKGKNYIELPYVVKGMDLSYSGLLTAANTKFTDGANLEDLCFSLQEVTFSMLTEITERALVHTEKSSILLTGGVAANKRLQEMLKSIADEHGVKFHVVSSKLAGDNGVMIAWTGLLQYRYGMTLSLMESKIRSKWRLDEIEIPWIDSGG
ncbi:MAG: bifunctional N(6)-L-threonylcarbamoyladenine synthase/serine/threonine protein kinase [Candidatus Helarchaeota archaeon]